MEHILDTLIGGLLSMLGAMVAIYIQSARARKNRADEILAEKRVEANAKAY